MSPLSLSGAIAINGSAAVTAATANGMITVAAVPAATSGREAGSGTEVFACFDYVCSVLPLLHSLYEGPTVDGNALTTQ